MAGYPQWVNYDIENATKLQEILEVLELETATKLQEILEKVIVKKYYGIGTKDTLAQQYKKTGEVPAGLEWEQYFDVVVPLSGSILINVNHDFHSGTIMFFRVLKNGVLAAETSCSSGSPGIEINTTMSLTVIKGDIITLEYRCNQVGLYNRVYWVGIFANIIDDVGVIQEVEA